MASILDKYRSTPTQTPEEIGQELKDQGVEMEEEATQSEVGQDNVNVAGGYENTGQEPQTVTDERLNEAWQQAQEEYPEIEDGLSQVQVQEEER